MECSKLFSKRNVRVLEGSASGSGAGSPAAASPGAAATDPKTQGLCPLPRFVAASPTNDASTTDSHLCVLKSPKYVMTAMLATCGRRFVAAATFVLVIVRIGKLELEVPYWMLVTLEMVSRIPLSVHEADDVPLASV